jgi:hypothetical protein
MSFKSGLLEEAAKRIKLLAESEFDNEDVCYAFQACIGLEMGFWQYFEAITKVPADVCSRWQFINSELPEHEVMKTYLLTAAKILKLSAEREKRELGESQTA